MTTKLKCSNETVNGLVRLLSNMLVGPDSINILRGLMSSRSFSRAHTNLNDFYNLLNVSRSASQNDIKNAYYKLSMLHHPDRNQDSEQAINIFREITNAYEVLSNPRTRKLYDEGLNNANLDQKYRPTKEDFHAMEPEVEDDAQTKFFKQHMRRNQRPDTYNNRAHSYDEWSKVHYTKIFKQNQNEKRRYERDYERDYASTQRDNKTETGIGSTIFGLIIVLILMSSAIGGVITKQNNADKTEGKPPA